MKKNLRTIVFYLILITVIIVAMYFILNQLPKEEVYYSQIAEYFDNEQVKSFEVDNSDYLTLVLRPEKEGGKEKTVTFRLRNFELFWMEHSEQIEEQRQKGIIETYNIEEPQDTPWWLAFLPHLIILGVIIGLFVYTMKQTTGVGPGKLNSFGRAKVKTGANEKTKVHFSDVAGADEEKEELKEIVDFLKDPSKYTKLGARIPHGVLLVGPPGTGKTLLAKAVAGEADVPFYSISGSDFVEMYVGVGASRVRDLFETAKKSPASIVFIDEIDAVGRHRGAGLGGGHDEREQTLNQLLVEMDGFGSTDGVIVMAATNRPDILDPALLRPGRFDRQITVNYPDIKGREEILKVHAKGKPFEADVDLEKIAQATSGFTGADLSNLLNEASLLAARANKSLIGMDEIEKAMLKVMVGTPKKSMKIKESEKRKTAFHEAGHALLAYFMPTQDPVRLISIIPSGRALGYTLNPPVEDKYSVDKEGLKEEIAVLLAGRVSESIVFGDISGGASNDIERATNIARSMVTRYGMSDRLGPILYGSEHNEVFLGRDFSSTRNYSEETAAIIDEEIKSIIDNAFTVAKDVLNEHIDKLHFVAEFLVKNETMDDAQFAAAMEGDPSFEDLEKLAENRRKKSSLENAERARKEEEERIRKETEERLAAEAADLERRRNNIGEVLGNEDGSVLDGDSGTNVSDDTSLDGDSGSDSGDGSDENGRNN